MDQRTLLFVVSALVGLGAGLFFFWYWQQQRRRHLQKRFGPEYEHAVEQFRDRHRAEAELVRRENKIKKLDLRPLSVPDQKHFESDWRAIQAGFVDSPGEAVLRAEHLLHDLMLKRGYPEVEDEELAAYLSVDHSPFVQNYHEAHEIALSHQRGEAGTEQLRRAVVYYRALFDDLLGSRQAA